MPVIHMAVHLDKPVLCQLQEGFLPRKTRDPLQTQDLVDLVARRVERLEQMSDICRAADDEKDGSHKTHQTAQTCYRVSEVIHLIRPTTCCCAKVSEAPKHDNAPIMRNDKDPAILNVPRTIQVKVGQQLTSNVDQARAVLNKT